MDGIHDLGGKQGFGAVDPQLDEPVFHAPWEGRVFGMVICAGPAGLLRNADQFRHAIERIDPVAYLTHGYYGRWLGGLETLAVEAGAVTRDALDARVAALGGDPAAPVAARPSALPDRVDYAPAERHSRRSVARPPRYRQGDAVRTRSTPRRGHTRLPAYARGRPGRIVGWHQGWVLPDSNAHGRGEQPEHLYTVAFSGEDLWGPETEPGLSVCLDLFESYLEDP